LPPIGGSISSDFNNLTRIAKRNITRSDYLTENLAYLKLYPNPTNGIVKVTYQLIKEEPVTKELVDINGAVVKSFKNIEGKQGLQEAELNLSSQRSGLYIVRVYGVSFNQSTKLSIVK
jgi:hypothetical protein